MADLYDIIAQYSVVEFLPPNRTHKLQEVVARSKPSNVVFYARLEPTDKLPLAVKAACNQIATALNADADYPGVSSITINQEVDANNQVDYTIDVEVVSSSGNSFQTLTLPWNDVWPPGMEKPVANAVAQLDAIEEA